MRERDGMRRWRAPGGRFWLTYLYIAIGVLLLVVAFVLLYPLRHTEGFARDLRLNVGSNLLDLVLAVLVLQPVVVTLSRNAVRRRNRLDYTDVIGRIAETRDHVDIWKHWTGLLEKRYEDAFVAAVRAALDRGVHFRIILTDPSCPDAAERARQVAPIDAVRLMRENIDRLEALIATLPAPHRELFRVGISRVGPAHAFYRVGDWLSYGLFRDRRVSESYQREVRVRGDLGELVLEAFDNRWNDAGVLAIAAHKKVRLRFVVNGSAEEHELCYVLHDGEHWVNVNPDALQPAFHPDHEVSVSGDGARRHVLAAGSPEAGERVQALYAAKYGPGQNVVLRRMIAG